MYLSEELSRQLYRHEQWRQWAEERGIREISGDEGWYRVLALSDLLTFLQEQAASPRLSLVLGEWRCAADLPLHCGCAGKAPDPTEAAGKCVLVVLEWLEKETERGGF